MSGVVIVDRFNSPKVTTAAQEAQLREYASLSTLAEREGYLSPTGRVSTAGAIEQEAARARALERQRAALAGTPYDSSNGIQSATNQLGSSLEVTYHNE